MVWKKASSMSMVIFLVSDLLFADLSGHWKHICCFQVIDYVFATLCISGFSTCLLLCPLTDLMFFALFDFWPLVCWVMDNYLMLSLAINHLFVALSAHRPRVCCFLWLLTSCLLLILLSDQVYVSLFGYWPHVAFSALWPLVCCFAKSLSINFLLNHNIAALSSPLPRVCPDDVTA